MGTQDAANWATIIGGVLGGLVVLTGLIYWLGAIYWDGRATRRICGQLDRRMRKQNGYIRRHARKSEKFHEQTNVRLENHERRLSVMEQAIPGANNWRRQPEQPPEDLSNDEEDDELDELDMDENLDEEDLDDDDLDDDSKP